MFIGVYGANGGGVYSSDSALEKSMKYIHSPQKKEFEYYSHAVNYVIYGLTEVHKICPRKDVNQDILYQKPNYFHRIPYLVKPNYIEAPFHYNF